MTVVEIVPVTQARREYCFAIEQLARSWDCDRPIRGFRSRADVLARDDVARLKGASADRPASEFSNGVRCWTVRADLPHWRRGTR
jgi:hypothetical protein